MIHPLLLFTVTFVLLLRQRLFYLYFLFITAYGLRQYLPNFGATIFNIDLNASHYLYNI